MAALRTSIYFDWVPSKANIADLPSRKAWSELVYELRGMGWSPSDVHDLHIPSVGEWRAPLASWIDRFEHHSTALRA